MIRGGVVVANGNGSPSSQKRQSFPPTVVSPYPPGYAAVAAADAASAPGFPPVAGAAVIPPAVQPQHEHANKYQLFNVMIKKNPGLGFSIAGTLDTFLSCE